MSVAYLESLNREQRRAVEHGVREKNAAPGPAHPEIAAFGAWTKSAPWTGSYAEERYNGLNSFVFTESSGAEHSVRWSLLPAAQPVSVLPDDLAKRGPDFLEQEITERVRGGPQRWTLVVTVANSGDPTADPSKAWPEDRRTVDVGTLTVQQIEPERDAPCRDINFDPTVLPSSMRTSDDPFPAARSSVYTESFDLRTAEAEDYWTDFMTIFYFGGFSCFHGSLTIGIVAISTLASLPSRFSTRRI
jgi:catalase